MKVSIYITDNLYQRIRKTKEPVSELIIKAIESYLLPEQKKEDNICEEEKFILDEDTKAPKIAKRPIRKKPQEKNKNDK